MLDSNKGELSQIWKKTMDLFVEKKDIDSVSFQSFYARSRLYDINQEFATVVVSTQIEKQVLQHELIDIQNILSSVVGYPVVCQLVLQKEIEMIEPAVVTQKRNEILFENKSESSLLSLFVCAECGHQCFAEKQHVVYGRTLRH